MAHKKKEGSQDDIIKDARDRLDESQDGSDFNRDNYYDDTRFARLAQQWPSKIRKLREQEGRPALTINKMPSFIHAVVNESRQNKPGIKVSPVDNGADEETAEVIGGLIRSIERNSNAEVAYDTAIDNAVTGGFGFFRVDIDYVHDDTFNMAAYIRRIGSALSVHWDTNTTGYDASDWDFAFISDWMSKRTYKHRYPEASMTPWEADIRDETAVTWIKDEQIRIAEYFQRTEKQRDLVQLSIINPETDEEEFQAVRADSLPDMAKRFFEVGNMTTKGMKDDELIRGFMEMSGTQERRRREVDYYEVKRHMINGTEELEEAEVWPGSSIPICPVWGDEVNIDGRRYFRSMIRDAKDAQLQLNYWRSASTELVALAPKAPWLIEEGAIPKGKESMWKSANTRNHAYLPYTKGFAQPKREPFAGVPAGALQEAMNANEDMQAITGIYPSSIGARSNETSGRAILARERQGDVANFHFLDNLSRAVRYCGQVLVEIIPSVYSPSETVRILGEDMKEKVVNLTQEDGASAYRKGIEGQPELYNIAIGKYDVEVKTGPSYGTQREETRETLIEIMRQVPDAAPFIGDVLLDHMDFVGADKIAKRLKHLLPPEVQKAESDEVTNADNPEAAALQQQLDAKDAETQQMQQAVMAEIQKIQGEAEQVKRENAQIKSDNQSDMAKLELDSQVKGRELNLKEQDSGRRDRELALKEGQAMIEAQKPVVTQQEEWAYDRLMEQDKQDHETTENELNRLAEAVQNDLDRQADITKVIIGKSDSGERGEHTNNVDLGEVMEQAATMLTAPKVILRDDFGNIIGSETVMPGVDIEDLAPPVDPMKTLLDSMNAEMMTSITALMGQVEDLKNVNNKPKKYEVVRGPNQRITALNVVIDEPTIN